MECVNHYLYIFSAFLLCFNFLLYYLLCAFFYVYFYTLLSTHQPWFSILAIGMIDIFLSILHHHHALACIFHYATEDRSMVLLKHLAVSIFGP